MRIYFNPRTREGCDGEWPYRHGDTENFNPRTREGCDLKTVPTSDLVVISIHAPVKGATEAFLHHNQLRVYFNPRTREGCDAELKNLAARAGDFNPRTREGCDLTPGYRYRLSSFQSTHP